MGERNCGSRPAQMSCTTDGPPCGRKRCLPRSRDTVGEHSNPTSSPGVAPVLCDSQVPTRTLTLASWVPINSSLTSKGNRWAGWQWNGQPLEPYGPLQSTGAPRIREPGTGTGSKLCHPGGHRTLGKQLESSSEYRGGHP